MPRFVIAAFSMSAAMLPMPVLAQSSAPIEQASVNGVTIAYRSAGPVKGRPILLLPGTGMQAIEWPEALVTGLVRQGFRVVMPEMRDSGGSTHFTDAGMPDWAVILPALGEGREPPSPYRAHDMAADVVGLLDALRIERADLLGISGGATIAELVALAAPGRVRSMTLIAANSGNRANPLPADPNAFVGQAQPMPGETKAARVSRRVDTARRLAAGEAFDATAETQLAERVITRDGDNFGAVRQGVAMLAAGDLRSRLASIAVPTVVIHGARDPLVSVQAGREVAEAIPGATFVTIDRMGHAMPPAAIPTILNAVRDNVSRAAGRP